MSGQNLEGSEFLSAQNDGIHIPEQHVLTEGLALKAGLETELFQFLRFGSPRNEYRTGNRRIQIEDAECISKLIESGSGGRAIEIIKHCSEHNRIYKQDYLIYALAICCKSCNRETKRASYDLMPLVCRIPTHLFQFIEYCKTISKQLYDSSGWGRGHRKAISNWYLSYGSKEDSLLLLAYHLTKYSKRKGWKHRDAIHLAHLKVKEDNFALKYLVKVALKGKKDADEHYFTQAQKEAKDYQLSVLTKVKAFVDHVEKAWKTENVEEMKMLILKYKLVREQIPNRFLKHREIWEALTRHMPMTAMIRNLGKMSNIGIFQANSFEEVLVCDKLKDCELITKGRIHPITYLVASNQYKKGCNREGTLRWPVSQEICNALEEGFTLSFSTVKPTEKHLLLAVEVTESMSKEIYVKGMSSLSALDAAAFMLMLMARTEHHYRAIVFSSKKVVELPVEPSDRSEDIVHKIRKLVRPCDSSTSDAFLSFKYALENNIHIDAFVMFTDSRTSFVHPAQAFKTYRQKVEKAHQNDDSRFIVCNMVSEDSDVGDFMDPRTMTISGFDWHVPHIVNDFLRSM